MPVCSMTHEDQEVDCNFFMEIDYKCIFKFLSEAFPFFMLAIIDMTELLKLGVRSVKCNTVEVCSSINYARK